MVCSHGIYSDFQFVGVDEIHQSRLKFIICREYFTSSDKTFYEICSLVGTIVAVNF